MLDVKPSNPVEAEAISNVTETASRGDDLYPVLLLGVLAFITIFPWHAVNQRLPFWDGANFVLTSQTIADAFDDGVLAGVKALYLERWWRPILFPTVAAPFFLLSGGQIRLSVGLAQFTFALILVIYVYAFLRQEYSTKRALVGSLLILGAPWLVNFSQQFFSELSWLAATAGLLYHLSLALRQSARSQYLLAGVWLGLMAAIRPIETVVVAFVPTVAFLVYALRRGSVRVADSALFVLQLLLVTLATGLAALPDRHWYVISLLLMAAIVVIGGRVRRFVFDSPFLVSLVCGELIAVAWHLPTMRLLYLWAQATSFGSLAQLSNLKFRGLSTLLSSYSPELLLTVVVLAIPGALNMFRPARNAVHWRAWALISAALLMMAPMVMLYAWSATGDSRRIMPGILVLYVGVIALALSPHGLLPRVRLACGLGIAMALLLAAAANGLNVKSNGLLKVQETFGYLRQPAVGQDPTGPVLESLLQMGIRSGNISAYTHCYHSELCNSKNVPWVEPVALSTLARERHLPLYVHFMEDLDFSTPETLAKQIQVRGFQYVLVDMLDLPEDVNRADIYVKHTDQFISMERGTLPAGLTSRGCFSTINRPICVIEVASAVH
jgi:Dolichyl-phosphate-mannose-protein mannosyltransferase